MDDQYRDQRKIINLLESLCSDDDVRGIDAEGIAIETGIKLDFVHEELDALMDEGRVIKFYDDDNQRAYYCVAV